ncbi:MAG: cytochrome c, partial [Verrucomicrobiota bacterium]
FIIQHNPTPSPERGGYKAENGKGGAHVNPNRDTSHGRIYRVVWKDGAASAIRSLKNASEADLVGALGSDNQFWRLTAQRLLVDGKKTGAIPALKALAATAQGVGAIHALWTLHGINALDTETHRAALLSKDPAVRRNAVRALPPSAASLYFSTGIVNDADLTTRLAALVKLAELPTTPELQTVVARLRKEPLNTQDEWLADATKMLVQKHHIRGAYVEGPNLLPNPDFEQEAKNLPAGWMVRHYDGKARQQIAGKLEARNGDHSLRLEGLPGEGADTSLFAVAVVKPRTDYKLSAWIKTKGVRGATGALLNVHSTPFQTEPVKGDSDWVQVETRFNSGDAKSVSVNCLLGGFGKSTGVAWFDDISLNELTPEADQPVRIVADAKRGEQIFRSHPLALCAQCHAVGGAGGNVGPALDGLASRKDEAYILESLVEPNAKMAEGFAGQVSPMPPMALILKEQEIADVKAYLLTLKAK